MIALFKWKGKYKALEEKNNSLENELASIRLKIQQLELENERLKQENIQIQKDIISKNKNNKMRSMIFEKIFDQYSKLRPKKEASK